MIPNDYPFNLIRAIYGDAKKDDSHVETTYIKGLYEQIKTLDHKEQTCLALRYKNGLTLKACGEHYGTSAQSIRQIINRSIRKLRHKSRAHYYEAVPKAELKRLEVRYEHLSEKNQQLNQALHVLNASDIDPDAVILLANMLKPEHLEAHIGELKLNTRAYNGLARAGLLTVKDIISTPENELYRMRNLGTRSVEEIKTKIKAYILLPDSYQMKQEDVT
jgi:predicted DNA-binding protein YlxM (UPF0122 family)